MNTHPHLQIPIFKLKPRKHLLLWEYDNHSLAVFPASYKSAVEVVRNVAPAPRMESEKFAQYNLQSLNKSQLGCGIAEWKEC